jgi:hypothetical protein
VAKIIGEKVKRKLITLYDHDIANLTVLAKKWGCSESEAIRIAMEMVVDLIGESRNGKTN